MACSNGGKTTRTEPYKLRKVTGCKPPASRES